jgi:hypothetical protein
MCDGLCDTEWRSTLALLHQIREGRQNRPGGTPGGMGVPLYSTIWPSDFLGKMQASRERVVATMTHLPVRFYVSIDLLMIKRSGRVPDPHEKLHAFFRFEKHRLR